MSIDKLDGFKKRRRREGEEEEDDDEGLSLKEYLERKQAEYSQAGKMNKKRVRPILYLFYKPLNFQLLPIIYKIKRDVAIK